MTQIEPREADARFEDTSSDAHVRWSEVLTRAWAPSLALVSLAVWLHAANSLLLATMVDAMLSEIGGEALVAWTVALYLVGSICAGAVSGLAATRFGLRPAMAAAAALFAFGCAVNALASSMEVVLGARLLQGIGGGGLMALSFVAVGRLFPPRLTARVIAVVSGVWGASALMGPLIGGLFVQYASWRAALWAFAAQAAVLALWMTFGLRGRALGAAGTKGTTRAPLLRLALIAAGVVSIASGGIVDGIPASAAAVAIGFACLWGARRLDARRGEDRMLPVGAFGLREPSGAALLMVLSAAFCLVAFTAYGPILMIRLHGATPLTAGYALGAISVSWSTAAVLASSLPSRRDPQTIALGMTLAALSLPGFALFVPEGPVAAIVAMGVMEGAGFGLAWTFILRRAQALAAPQDAARVASALPTAQQLGYAAGAAYAGIAANAAGFAADADAQTLREAARLLFLAPLPAAVLCLVAMVRFTRAPLPGRAVA